MESKIREFKELQQLIEEAETELEAIKDQIKAEMEARGVQELTVDIFKVRWMPVVSRRFDATAFKKTHNELYQQYLKETEIRRFTVA